jgi:hypothetical protein
MIITQPIQQGGYILRKGGLIHSLHDEKPD